MSTASVSGPQSSDNAKTRSDIEEIQRELRSALTELSSSVGAKLSADAKRELEEEFAELDEILDRLKTGLVWISLFGKTSVGKSALANAVIESDMAKVGTEKDLTSTVSHFRRDPWMIADMPGVMGREEFAAIALDEARRSHGIIFVVDSEPYRDELEMFEMVHSRLPKTPKIVFVNKWDEMKFRPTSEREKVKQLIVSKMRKFVASDNDIVFGSALSFNPDTDTFERQTAFELIDRMYEGAGTLGMVTNILDPAHRADELAGKIRDRVMEIRVKLARKVISGFAAAEVAGSYVPLTTLITTPGLLAGMVYTIMKILGVKSDREAAKKLSIELLKVCGVEMAAEFAAVTAVEVALLIPVFIFGPIGLFGALGAAGALGYYKYKRTAVFGEVAIEYVRNDCSWGGEERHEVIKRCRERAKEHHMKFKLKHNV